MGRASTGQALDSCAVEPNPCGICHEDYWQALLVDAQHDGLVELWTVRSAAHATGLSKSASCRIWASGGLMDDRGRRRGRAAYDVTPATAHG